MSKLLHADGTRCAGETCAWKGDGGHRLKFQVEILRLVTVTVDVAADTPEAAAAEVDKRDFPVPSVADGDVLKGWEYVVYDADGEELHRVEP